MASVNNRPIDSVPSAVRTRRAWGALVVVGAGILVASIGMQLVGEAHRNAVINLVYSAWVGFALWHVFRTGSFASVGLTGRRFWLGLALAVPVSVLLVMGTLGDPTMKGATLIIPGGLKLFTMALISVTAALGEQLAICGYMQLRFEEVYGRLVGILVSAAIFTAFHLSLLWLPGAVPPQGISLGQMAFGLFVGLALWAVVVSYTRNVWALALAAGLNSLLQNMLRLSVRPGEVLVGDPRSMVSGIMLLLSWLFAMWLVTRMIATSTGPFGPVVRSADGSIAYGPAGVGRIPGDA